MDETLRRVKAVFSDQRRLGDNIKIETVDENDACESHGYGNWIIQGDIQENCIDKQRVREAIEKKITEHDDGDCNYDALCALLKELGLEKE